MTHYDISNNINRVAWCILGLPFDVMTKKEVIAELMLSASNKTPCFVSTPNINFLIASHKDKVFRDSVINSNLSVVDGTPIVWIARLLRIPVPERVAGSDLVDSMISDIPKDNAIKVFFFGGEDNVADIACSNLNNKNAGLTCVGNLNPGFVSVDEMSTNEIIENINNSAADFIIVSLGAKKGQEWIEQNKNKINAPIMSHLGAVVNFVAGKVSRSPTLLRRCGLEWIWRIKEEPTLWRRYFYDGISLVKLLLFKVMPLSVIIFRNRKKSADKLRIETSTTDNKVKLFMQGFAGLSNGKEINEALNSAVNTSFNVEIILGEGSYVDGTLLAKLQFLKKYLFQTGRNLSIVSKSKLVTKIFSYNCCDYLLYQEEK